MVVLAHLVDQSFSLLREDHVPLALAQAYRELLSLLQRIIVGAMAIQHGIFVHVDRLNVLLLLHHLYLLINYKLLQFLRKKQNLNI